MDPATVGMAISAGSALLGALGGKKKTGGPVDPYTFFPEVKDALKNNVLPQAETIARQPYPARPMMRATDPSQDPFASIALWQLQRMRDTQGPAQTPAPAPAPAPQAMPMDQMQGLYTLASGRPIFSPGYGTAHDYRLPEDLVRKMTPEDFGAVGRIGTAQTGADYSAGRNDFLKMLARIAGGR